MPEKRHLVRGPSNGSAKRRRTRSPTSGSELAESAKDVQHIEDEPYHIDMISATSACRVEREVPPEDCSPRPLIVHRVNCTSRSTSAKSHADHEAMAYFLDVPRLYEGDNKTQPLRGTETVEDLDSYMEDNPWISFVVTRDYDCVEYHELAEVSSHFIRLVAPSSHAQMPGHVRPYLSVLGSHTEPAAPTRERITLCSPPFIEAVNQIQLMQTEQTDLLLHWDNEDSLDAPYLQFYHARSLLEDGRKRLDSAIHEPQITGLLTYLNTHFGHEYAEADRLFQEGYCNQAHFHKLFGPGSVVTVHPEGHEVGLMVRRCPRPDKVPITLDCESWTFDGAFHKVEMEVVVQLPPGIQPDDKILISSLAAVPLAYEKNGMRENLIRRGSYFWKCRHGRLVASEAPKRGFDIQVTNPRYMIDMETFKALHGEEDEAQNQADTLSWRGDLSPEELQAEDPPPGNFVLLLPPTIKAFRFHDKKWKTLAVEHLRDVVWDTEAFSKLVFNKQKKKLIKALVKNHVANSASADIIESKGNGLVILLHGPPGTGKTLTAESVAEFSNRPLYRLTSGDIGTDPETVEKSLEHIFYLGNIWKAVVLLDECEVFMEQRVASDLKRNALVSVFLRALEYYDGILILTSNRVGTFDEAFKSRMHLAVYYPPLGKDDREVIWSNFFSRLADEREQDSALDIDVKGLKDSSSSLAQIDLNGRQIRNAVRTARQLALYDNETFSTEHIREYIKVVKEFETYVEETQGDSSSKLAELAGVRKDPTPTRCT